MTQQTTEVPESLAKAAEEHKWPLEMVRQGLAAGLAPERIEQAIRSGLRPDQAMQLLAQMRARAGASGALGSLQSTISPAQQQAQGPPPLDMSWASAPTERGRLPPITDKGLELGAIEGGSYGFVPDHWPLENDTPRGAYLPPETANLAASYTIYDKSEVWADNAAFLYEEAIRGHWVSATAVPWESLRPLPRHEELAIDQICTNWSEWAHLGLEAVSKWLEEISYGFHEVKLYLATVCFDYGRQTEAFRKRALANGGGLGVQTPGVLNRAIYSAMKFSEMAAMLLVLRTSFQLSLWEGYGSAIARTDADRKLLELASRDLRRHLDYGLEHIKYFVQTQPAKRNYMHTWLNRGEASLAAELRRNKPQNEALMLLLDPDPRVARTKLESIWKRQLEEYRQRLKGATLADHKVSEFLLGVIEPQPVAV
jgi:hypothetical protein